MTKHKIAPAQKRELSRLREFLSSRRIEVKIVGVSIVGVGWTGTLLEPGKIEITESVAGASDKACAALSVTNSVVKS